MGTSAKAKPKATDHRSSGIDDAMGENNKHGGCHTDCCVTVCCLYLSESMLFIGTQLLIWHPASRLNLSHIHIATSGSSCQGGFRLYYLTGTTFHTPKTSPLIHWLF